MSSIFDNFFKAVQSGDMTGIAGYRENLIKKYLMSF